MSRLTAAFCLLLLAAAGLALWVRLAPADPAAWNVDPAGADPEPRTAAISKARVTRYRSGAFATLTRPEPAAALLARLDAIARATPRTRRLAGSAAEGRITWETRSALWGFPDYATAQATQSGGVSTLQIHARQRFGAADFGVNANRVTGWLNRL